MSEEKTTATPAANAEKPAKLPAPEEKPFEEFIGQHFVPSLKEGLTEEGIDDIDFVFTKQPLPIPGMGKEAIWQVQGRWLQGQRQFLVAFQQETIKGPKFYSAADRGAKPTTLESFMIDEKKITLDLMVMYVIQRLNAQKWLIGN